MIRKINATGLAHIKKWEGLRTKAYQDISGIWTIGYGHTAAAGEPKPHQDMVISAAQAETILAADLHHFEAAVGRHVKVVLNDHQFAVLVSFCYNIGEEAFRRSTLVRKLNRGEYDSVPAELAKWVHAKGKRVQGLVNRRAAEAGLWVREAFVASHDQTCTRFQESPYLKPEILAPGITAAAGLSGLVNGQGPFQWVLALIMLGSFMLAVWYIVRRIREGNG